MKKIIIVAPHFPPSNLAAVHRSRLFAQHLPSFGWVPIIVAVHEKYYEEDLDPNIVSLLPEGLRVEKTMALSTKPIKLIGDIGIRGFVPLLTRILKLSKSEKIDFIYIPIPANFTSLLGPLVRKLTGIPYGIDYIDPWVHPWPGSEKYFSKAWWSMKLGTWLEPVAVRKAKLITGVAPGYYQDVLKRHPHLQNTAVACAMPYGGEVRDHEILKTFDSKPYLFEKKIRVRDLIYAGALLPKAVSVLEAVFKTIGNNKDHFAEIRFHFIGTGKSPNNPNSYNIKHVAEKYGIWNTIIFEYPKRIPYLDVLSHLLASDGTFILGSTEPHYTPSKLYQSVLSGKPIFAILHKESTACQIIKETGAGIAVSFEGSSDLKSIESEFMCQFRSYLELSKFFDSSKINREAFEMYSAKSVTAILVDAIERCLRIQNTNVNL